MCTQRADTHLHTLRHTHCLVSPIAVSLHDFESDVEALDDLLAWLAEGAVRIKALLADTAGGIGVAAETWAIPPGIMPPFPEKSNFGEVRGALLYLVEPRIAGSLRYRLREDEKWAVPRQLPPSHSEGLLAVNSTGSDSESAHGKHCSIIMHTVCLGPQGP